MLGWKNAGVEVCAGVVVLDFLPGCAKYRKLLQCIIVRDNQILRF